MYRFDHLPAYAAYLLEQRLDEYTRENIRLSYEAQVPLLKFFAHLPPEEIFRLSLEGTKDFLEHLSANRVRDFIETSLQRWLSNQLPMVGMYDIQAKDITLISYIRGRLLRRWLPEYTQDVQQLMTLQDEIDRMLMGQNTTSFDSYIRILKNKIQEEYHFSQNLLNASPGITYIYDLQEGKEVYVSGRVKDIIGYTPEDILGFESDLVQSLLHPEDVGTIADLLQRVLADTRNETHESEYRFRDKGGEYHWLRSYVVPYKRDAEGSVVQVLGVAYEITNEKETANALRKRERQLLEAQSIAHLGSYEWDIVRDISDSTPELRKIYEADHRQTLEEMMEHVHPDDAPKLRNALAEAFRSGSLHCEFRYRAASGEKVVDSRGAVSFDASGKPLSMVGTVQDVTERKRIEDSLFQKTLELERSNVQLREFAYVASHDLKEPLRKIGMFSNIIITTDWDSLSEKTRSSLQKITDAAQRMQQLIEGILSYSSLTEAVKKENVPLQAILDEVLSNLEFKIQETGARIEADPLPEVPVVPFQFQQLLQNLISNALKFARRDVKPLIRIRCRFLPPDPHPHPFLKEADRYLELRLEDNGIGFSPQAREKIFGLFQRLHNRTEYEGSGLGLAIARKIVENHGGVIDAHSTPGEGSVFTIVIPAV